MVRSIVRMVKMGVTRMEGMRDDSVFLPLGPTYSPVPASLAR
jgi:hypothetical protein